MTSSSAVRYLRLTLRREHGDSELFQDSVGHRRRRAGQRVAAARNLREWDDLADIRLPGHQREEPLDAHRKPSVWRRAHPEGVEQEAELRTLLFLGHTHDTEDRLLHLRTMDSDRARAEFPAVPDQVVMPADDSAGIRLDALLVG